MDDDDTVRVALVAALKAAGHIVFAAENGLEGMRHVAAIRPDLIITDLFMPEQEGLETIAELRKQNPYLSIIAISGGSTSSPAMLSVASRLGAIATLEKPFDLDTLMDTVEWALKMKPKQVESKSETEITPIMPESH